MFDEVHFENDERFAVRLTFSVGQIGITPLLPEEEFQRKIHIVCVNLKRSDLYGNIDNYGII